MYLVFMIKSLVKNYKQPVMYEFCQSSTNSTTLKSMIVEVIEACPNVGLKIVATISDQAVANVAAINALVAKT